MLFYFNNLRTIQFVSFSSVQVSLLLDFDAIRAYIRDGTEEQKKILCS